MDHFSPSDWVDFVRGLPGLQFQAMRNHLEQGCSECRQTLATWSLVPGDLAAEQEYDPPEQVVRLMKASYAQAQPERWLTKVADFARLIFDSRTEPQLATVRALTPSSRLLLHEAEPFTIDLRLESDPVRNRISLTGQVLSSREMEPSPQDIDVILLRGEHLVRKTSANTAGEFILDFGPGDNLQLFINIRGQRAIGIVLPEVEA